MNIRYLLIGALALAVAAVFVYSKVGTSTPVEANSVEVIAGEYVEGVHYRTTEGNNAASTSKIKVQEFFWYGCPHCEKFEPSIIKYKETIADDVELVQVPVIWNEATKLHAAFYYLAEKQNAPNAFHAEMFKKIIALRKEGNLDAHIEAAEEIFASHGLGLKDFKAQLQSPEVQMRLAESTQLMKSLAITGTPTLAVEGTWVVLNNEAVSRAGGFNVVDGLVEQARAARQN